MAQADNTLVSVAHISALLPSLIVSGPEGVPPELTNAMASAAPQPDSDEEIYRLVGEDGSLIADNLRTYAFAWSVALRWSADLGAPVKMLYHRNGNDLSTEVVAIADYNAMSRHEYEAELYHAHVGRLKNAIDEMTSCERDIASQRSQAQMVLNACRKLYEVDSVRAGELACLLLTAAETYEAMRWVVLIDEDDEDMAAELRNT